MFLFDMHQDEKSTKIITGFVLRKIVPIFYLVFLNYFAVHLRECMFILMTYDNNSLSDG